MAPARATGRGAFLWPEGHDLLAELDFEERRGWPRIRRKGGSHVKIKVVDDRQVVVGDDHYYGAMSSRFPRTWRATGSRSGTRSRPTNPLGKVGRRSAEAPYG